MDTNKCYSCKYRRNIPGDAHSACAHPEFGIKTDSPNIFESIVGMLSGRCNDSRFVTANPMVCNLVGLCTHLTLILLGWNRARDILRINPMNDEKYTLLAMRELLEALINYMHAMEGFSDAVRAETGRAYPWPAQEIMRERAKDVITLAEGMIDTE